MRRVGVVLVVLLSMLVVTGGSLVAAPVASYQGAGAFTGTVFDDTKGVPVPGVTVNLLGTRTLPAGVNGASCYNANTVSEQIKVFNDAAQFVGYATVNGAQYTMALVPGFYQAYSKTVTKVGLFSATSYSVVKVFGVSSNVTTTLNFSLSTECRNSPIEPNVAYIIPGPFSTSPTVDVTLDSGATDASGAYSIGVASWPNPPAGTQWMSTRVAISPTFGVFAYAGTGPATAQNTSATGVTFSYPVPQERVPVNFTFRIPLRHRLLMDYLSYSAATVATKTPAELENIIEQNANALGAVVTKYDGAGNITVIGTPASNQPSIETQNLPHTGALLPPGSQFPNGYRMASTVTADAATIINRLDHAYNFLSHMYQGNTTQETTGPALSVVKEYPGIPLWTSRVDQPGDATFPRLLGHYYDNRWLTKTMWVSWAAEGAGWDTHSLQATPPNTWSGSGAPEVWVDRYFTVENGLGHTEYVVTPVNYSAAATEDLWLGNIFMSHLGQGGLPFDPAHPDPVEYVCDGAWSCPTLAAHRYTIRHATSIGRYTFAIKGEMAKSYNLGRTLATSGFGPDLRDPLYGRSAWRSDDFIYGNDIYHDCDLGIQGQVGTPGLPWGRVNNGDGTPKYTLYGYESKVCNAVAPYIYLSRFDPGSWAIQAIHILNKYGDADHAFIHPQNASQVTPRQMARQIETQYWMGLGVHGYQKDPQYASGYRTAIFLILETLLGYRFGDTTSRAYADATANILMEVQAGTQSGATFRVDTWDKGLITRPVYTGAPMMAWRLGHSLDFGLPTSGVFQDLIDVFNMPNETAISALIGNSETTEDYIQALRVYLYLKYGQTYGEKALLPRVDIAIPANNNGYDITWTVGLDRIPANWRASDVLASLNAQGAAAKSTQMFRAGLHYMCCVGASCAPNTCPDTPNGNFYNFPVIYGAAMDIALAPGSPAIQWRIPGAVSDDTAITYHLVRGTASAAYISIPAVTAPAVAINSQQLLDKIRAACADNNIRLFRRTSNPFVWTEFVSGSTPWLIDRNAGYYVDMSTAATEDCYFTP